ncbi:transcription factor bHLH167-like [Triticum dicoccoides]|uniref:transcription factor bHLH167-like n=1 Tax=Triticum dicoccoides TaxID=85692 RepID=UPI00188EFE4C|nr:transcription factor bHLH167-like [Triticum dicoccoides]
MKSRRQSGRGGAMLLPDGNLHSSGSKMERKDVEKNRRLHMKGLCLKLSSLVPASSSSDHHLRHYSSSPPSSNKDAATQLDQLDSAAAYIKQLRGRIDDLKRRKQAAVSGTAGCSSSISTGDYKGAPSTATTALPVIEVRHQDGTLDVALVSEVGRPFRLHEVIAVLEQEGAEVVSASFSVVGDKIFYTVHSQALYPRIGLEAGRVAQGLRGLAAAAAVSPSVLLT